MKVAVVRFANSGHVEAFATMAQADARAKDAGATCFDSVDRNVRTYYENKADMKAAESIVCMVDFVEVES